MESLPHVTLRALEPEDLELLYRVENDRELWSVGTTNVPYSRYALHEYLASVTGDIYVDKQVRLIMENDEGATVGMIDLTNFAPQHRRAEVGIVVQRAYRDRGYGRAALTQLVGYARSVVHLHQLYAIVDEDNASCLRLFEEVGFRRVGVLKDWLYDGEHDHNAIFLQFFI